MKYSVLQNECGKKILLYWPRPFTWEDYPITGYEIVCRDPTSMNPVYDITRNDTETVNRYSLTEIVDYPDCYTLQCNVTAQNALDKTQTSFSLPLSKFAKQLDLKTIS